MDREVARAGMAFISRTRLSHSIPSATANDTKIAPATAANPMVFSMAVSPCLFSVQAALLDGSFPSRVLRKCRSWAKGRAGTGSCFVSAGGCVFSELQTM
jgi:hypothetical protein